MRDAGCGMINRKPNVTWRTATLTRRILEKHSEYDGMAGLSQKSWRDVGWKKVETDLTGL